MFIGSISLSRIPRANFVALDNFSKEIYGVSILNSLCKNREKDGVIDGIEEFTHIAFKGVAWAGIVSGNFAKHIFNSQHSVVRSLTNTARKRSCYKCWLKDRIKNLKDSVVQDAIADNRLVYMPKFWVMNPEIFVWTMFVRSTFQIPVETKNVLLKIKLKGGNIGLVPLATSEFVPRQKQVLWVSNF